MRNPKVFADVCNYILYEGKQVIKPEELVERDGTEETVLQGENDKDIISVQRYRDLLKNWVFMETKSYTIAILGLENQTDIQYNMVVRSMLYDALGYTKQVQDISRKNVEEGRIHKNAPKHKHFQKEDRVKPIITIVLYWGEDEWDGARTLHDIIDFSGCENLKDKVADYEMQLIVPANIIDYEMFQTNFKYVLAFIKNSKNEEEMKQLLEQYKDEYRHMDSQTANLLNVLTKINITVEEGEVDMCKAWEEHKESGRREGRQEGRCEGKMESMRLVIENMLQKNMLLTDIMDITEMTEEEILAIQSSM